MWKKFLAWRKAKVRLIQFGSPPHYSLYIRFTPSFGFGIPWFGKRLRFAMHHGLQLVEWRNNRWVVTKQLLGTSKVKGERKGERYGPVRNA